MKPEKLCHCGSGRPYGECHGPIEEKLAHLRAQGNRIPTRKMLKNAEQIAGIREAGRINSLVLDCAAREIRIGMTTEELNHIIDEETRRLGGFPAPLGYEGFPKSVCISVNDVVCHGIPSEKVVLHDGDIVNVDCTTIVNGYYGDASRMFCMGNVAPDAQKLVDVTKQAVDEALAHLTPYCHLGDIGYYIDRYARGFGYSVVRDIGGHGVGLKMHEDPYVCHVGRLGSGMILAPGMIFTIEPMINAGKEAFEVRGEEAWEVYTADGSLSAQWEVMVLMTEEGFEILSQ